MIDPDALIKVDPDAFIKMFRAKQEAHALDLVERCANDEASLLVCKRALETMIEIHQEVIIGIDNALRLKQC